MNLTVGTTTVHATRLYLGSLLTLCGAETRHTRSGIGSKNRAAETMHPVTCKTCQKRMHTTD